MLRKQRSRSNNQKIKMEKNAVSLYISIIIVTNNNNIFTLFIFWRVLITFDHKKKERKKSHKLFK